MAALRAVVGALALRHVRVCSLRSSGIRHLSSEANTAVRKILGPLNWSNEPQRIHLAIRESKSVEDQLKPNDYALMIRTITRVDPDFYAANEVLSRMLCNGQKPTVSVLSALLATASTLDPTTSLSVFELFSKYGVVPNQPSFMMAMAAASKLRDGPTCLRLIQQATEHDALSPKLVSLAASTLSLTGDAESALSLTSAAVARADLRSPAVYAELLRGAALQRQPGRCVDTLRLMEGHGVAVCGDAHVLHALRCCVECGDAAAAAAAVGVLQRVQPPTAEQRPWSMEVRGLVLQQLCMGHHYDAAIEALRSMDSDGMTPCVDLISPFFSYKRPLFPRQLSAVLSLLLRVFPPEGSTAPASTGAPATDGAATDGAATDGAATDGAATDGAATDGAANALPPLTATTTAAVAGYLSLARAARAHDRVGCVLALYQHLLEHHASGGGDAAQAQEQARALLPHVTVPLQMAATASTGGAVQAAAHRLLALLVQRGGQGQGRRQRRRQRQLQRQGKGLGQWQGHVLAQHPQLHAAAILLFSRHGDFSAANTVFAVAKEHAANTAAAAAAATATAAATGGGTAPVAVSAQPPLAVFEQQLCSLRRSGKVEASRELLCQMQLGVDGAPRPTAATADMLSLVGNERPYIPIREAKARKEGGGGGGSGGGGSGGGGGGSHAVAGGKKQWGSSREGGGSRSQHRYQQWRAQRGGGGGGRGGGPSSRRRRKQQRSKSSAFAAAAGGQGGGRS